jgi:hypothetical protein
VLSPLPPDIEHGRVAANNATDASERELVDPDAERDIA